MAYSMRTEMHNYLTPLQGRTMMNEGVRSMSAKPHKNGEIFRN